MSGRRHFIKALGGSILLAKANELPALLPPKKTVSNEILITPYSPNENLVNDFISIVSLSDLKLHMIPCSKINAHGVAQHPIERSRVIVFSQFGTRSVEVDINNKMASRQFDSVKDHLFYGHGSFSRDGSVLYSTEYDAKESQGIIAIRDAKSYKPIGRVPSHGVLPHEIYLMPDQKTAVVANQGFKPTTSSRFLNASICYVELASGKLLHKINTTENDIIFGHLAVNARGQVAGGADHKIAIQGASTADARSFIFEPVPVYFGEIGKPTQIMYPTSTNIRKKCLSSLSLCMNDSTDEVAITYPEGGIVNFWSMKDFKLKGSIDLKGQRPLGVGVVHGGKQFVVNTTDSQLHFIDSHSHSIIKTIPFAAKSGEPARYFQGPHLVCLS